MKLMKMKAFLSCVSALCMIGLMVGTSISFVSAEDPEPVNLLAGKNPVEQGMFTNDDFTDFTHTSDQAKYPKLTDGDKTKNRMDFKPIGSQGGSSGYDPAKEKPFLVYDLGGSCDLSSVTVVAASDGGNTLKGWTLYASATVGDLFSEEKQVVSSDQISVDKKQTLDQTKTIEEKQVRYVAFVFTHGSTWGDARLYELEVFGNPCASLPDTYTNIILNKVAVEKGMIKDGDYTNLLKGVDGETDQLTDGNTEEKFEFKPSHTQASSSKPQIDEKVYLIYDLGAKYDIAEAILYAYKDMPQKTITGWEVYASDVRDGLFDPDNQVAQTIVRAGLVTQTLDAPAAGVQYVALVLSHVDVEYGNVRLIEFELMGMKSEEQPSSTENILKGWVATEGGLIVDDNYDRWYDDSINCKFDMLTDGDRNTQVDLNPSSKEASKEGGKPVLVYDMNAYFDLDRVAVYAFPDNMNEKIVKAWTVYASKNRADLYKPENKIAETTVTKETVSQTLPVEAKGIRYISFVFTHTDTTYGDVRLYELEAYGVKVGSIETEKPTEPTKVTEATKATEPTEATDATQATTQTEATTPDGKPTRTGDVEGKLLDKDGTPLQDVKLLLKAASMEAVTDADGRFAFADVPVGEYTLYMVLDDGTELSSEFTFTVAEGETVALACAYDGEAFTAELEQIPKTGVGMPVTVMMLAMLAAAALCVSKKAKGTAL